MTIQPLEPLDVRAIPPVVRHATIFGILERLSPGDAFSIERMRAQSALAQRIVDYGDAVGENPFAELVLEEARTARDGGAVDGAGERTEQRSGDAWVIDDRNLLCLNLARIEAAHGAFAGAATDTFGRGEIGSVDRGRIIVVAFHAGAFARDGSAGRRGLALQSLPYGGYLLAHARRASDGAQSA